MLYIAKDNTFQIEVLNSNSVNDVNKLFFCLSVKNEVFIKSKINWLPTY